MDGKTRTRFYFLKRRDSVESLLKKIYFLYIDFFKKITLEECVREKEQITEIVQIDNIYRFKNMIRWANITRMKKVSILRLNFNGTIGKVDGKYLSTINEKIRTEFFE